MNVNQIKSQVKLTEVAVARIAYQKWSHGMSYIIIKFKIPTHNDVVRRHYGCQKPKDLQQSIRANSI